MGEQMLVIYGTIPPKIDEIYCQKDDILQNMNKQKKIMSKNLEPKINIPSPNLTQLDCKHLEGGRHILWFRKTLPTQLYLPLKRYPLRFLNQANPTSKIVLDNMVFIYQ